MKTPRLILLLASFLLAGCAAITRKPEADADYGPVPANYESAIAVVMGVPKENLFYDPPRRAYRKDGWLWGGKVGWHGYAVRVRRFKNPVVNAIAKPITDMTGKSIDLVAFFAEGRVFLVMDYDQAWPNLHWVEEDKTPAT